MNKTHFVVLATLTTIAILLFTKGFKDDAFANWKVEFNVNFVDAEDQYRRIIFNRNVEKINKHNADPSQTYKMGINQFTAMTDAEFVQRYLHQLPQLP
jgi:hypothetical protein